MFKIYLSSFFILISILFSAYLGSNLLFITSVLILTIFDSYLIDEKKINKRVCILNFFQKLSIIFTFYFWAGFIEIFLVSSIIFLFTNIFIFLFKKSILGSTKFLISSLIIYFLYYSYINDLPVLNNFYYYLMFSIAPMTLHNFIFLSFFPLLLIFYGIDLFLKIISFLFNLNLKDLTNHNIKNNIKNI